MRPNFLVGGIRISSPTAKSCFFAASPIRPARLFSTKMITQIARQKYKPCLSANGKKAFKAGGPGLRQKNRGRGGRSPDHLSFFPSLAQEPQAEGARKGYP